MAEAVMRFPGKAELYARQYRAVADTVRQPYDTEVAEAVLAGLCNRMALEGAPEMQADLAEADVDLARAASQCDGEWRERLDRWATACGFALSPWWLAVRSIARQLRGETTTPQELLWPLADLWLKVGVADAVGGLTVPVDAAKLIESLKGGVRAAVADLLGLSVHERGGQYVRELRRLADLRTAVLLPTSLTMGFRLPRADPESGSSPVDPTSEKAVDLYLAVAAAMDREGDHVDVAALIRGDLNRERVMGSVRSLRAALPAAGSLELRSPDGRTARVRKPAARPRPHPVHRPFSLTGRVTAIDLDSRTMRVRAADDGPHTELAYGEPTLFLRRREARLWLDSRVTVDGATTDPDDPPAHGVLTDITPADG